MENDKTHIDIKTHDLDQREKASTSINKAALSSEVDLVLEVPKVAQPAAPGPGQGARRSLNHFRQLTVSRATPPFWPYQLRSGTRSTQCSSTTSTLRVLPNEYNYFVGETSLSQPALAKVNRQLRAEVLPMWYSMKSFKFYIRPWFHHYTRLHGPWYVSGCDPSQVDKAWLRFLTRFLALENGADGRDYLSYVNSLEVELWQPDRELLAHRGFGFRGDENTVSLQFGHVDGEMYRTYRRVGRDNTDWSRRDEVRAELDSGGEFLKDQQQQAGFAGED
ncbi:hypothetical protein Daus18300_013128 [Diaporthe australafricana]|uniref:Aerobactin siderophore biosynthesis protein iucB n=1 Tax=Diaporthe australafricana TaxID=127596 RepID=A0ABR3W0D7_9PEZI